MKVDIAYGKEGLTIDVPERNLVKILRMAEKTVIPDPHEETLKSLASPAGTPPLAEMARGKTSACIVVSDITRPVPNSTIVPPIIQVLEDVGEIQAPARARGCHRPKRLARDLGLVWDLRRSVQWQRSKSNLARPAARVARVRDGAKQCPLRLPGGRQAAALVRHTAEVDSLHCRRPVS